MEKMIMKKGLLYACFIINLLFLAFYATIIIAAFLRLKEYIDYVFLDETFAIIRMVLAIPVLVLWVNNLIVWSKKDKHIGRFLLLFFLIGLYSPFYYIKVLKNKWQ